MSWKADLIQLVDQIDTKLSEALRERSARKIKGNIKNNNYNNQQTTIFLDFVHYIHNVKSTFKLNSDDMNIANIIIYEKIDYFIKEQLVSTLINNFKVDDNDETEGNLVIDVMVLNTFQQLHDLDWIHCYHDQYMIALTHIIESKIITYFTENEYNIEYLPQLDFFIKNRLSAYIRQILSVSDPVHLHEKINDNNGDCNNKCIQNEDINDVMNELRYASFDLYTKHRSKSLFEIIADYPDSIISIYELRETINITNNIGFIGKNLRAVLTKRLLHIGASTLQILDFYILMIKVLRIIDPSDILLSYVAKPIRNYLLNRPDTIRSIITLIIDCKDNNLYLELKRGGSLAFAPDEDDEDDGYGENWEPRKRNKELIESNSSNKEGSRSGSTRTMDTLALLVSIYGSTDIFIVEYRSLLADKLLNSAGFITDNEVTNLELLKIRFGEESLHSCEVMLKDVEDSKRINNTIHSEWKTNSNSSSSNNNKVSQVQNSAQSQVVVENQIETMVDFMIISDNYWPTLPSDHIQYHETLSTLLQKYQASYEIMKKPRKLLLVPTVGQVEVELSFDDGCLRSFLVTPLQANLILYLNDQRDTTNICVATTTSDSYNINKSCIFSLQKLSDSLQVDADELYQNGIIFWILKSILIEIHPNGSTIDDTVMSDRYFQINENQLSI